MGDTEKYCFGVAGVCGVLAAICGTYMIAKMDQLSKVSLISLSVLLSILLIVLITLVVVGAILTESLGSAHGTHCEGAKGECGLLMAAFILSGFSMMLNIRLCYSTAPYALMRFKLPENIFSVFVRRVASSMELWCLPTLLVADALEHGAKIAVHNTLTVFGQALVKDDGDSWPPNYAKADQNQKLKLATIIGPSVLSQWLNFLTYVLLLFVYVPGDQGHLTAYYWVIAASGLVFGINNPLTFAVDEAYLPIYIAGENCFPATTSLIHYLSSLVFGNRRRYNSDFIMVYIDLVVAIILSLLSAVVWTIGFLATHDSGSRWKHLKGTGPYSPKYTGHAAAGFLQVLFGLGMVYAIYPGIAPGLIVPFYLIDKIEMTLLIMTIVPALCVALVRNDKIASGYGGWDKPGSPTCKWGDGWGVVWHTFDLIIPIMIILASIFIYSIHYRDSALSRSIINQPKMSTFLTILYYMCSEIGIAIGFPGTFGNNAGGDGILALATQLIAIFVMTFLALYSEGYLIEYKKHDPSQWPTLGMTRWNAFKYWCKMGSKNTNQNIKSLFTKDVRRDLLLCIERDNLI